MAALQEYANEAAQLTSEGKYLEAVEAYDKILELNEEIAEVHLNKGVALAQAQELPKALDAFKRAAELKPELAGAHMNAGNILKRMGKHEEAAECYRDCVETDPTMVNAWTNLAHELNALERYEEAVEAVSDGIKKCGTSDVSLHNERIFAYFKMREADKAIDDVEAVLKGSPMETLSPDQRELYCLILSRKGSQLMSDGKQEAAVEYLERACEGYESADNLFTYGVCLLQLDRKDEAIPVLKKAQNLSKNGNWRIPVALGTVYLQLKQFGEACKAFEAALKHAEPKKDPNVQFNYAVALLNVDRDSEAKPALEFVVSEDPENHIALALLGTIYIHEQDYASAVEALERAAELPGAKDDSSIFYNLGYAQLMSDKGDDALTNFEQALEINPDNEQAKSAVNALQPDGPKKRMSKRDIEEVVKIAQERSADPRKSTRDMIRAAEKAENPLDRAKAMLSPARPAYLRRKSMEGIQLGYVTTMAEAYDELTRENWKPSY